MMSCWEYEADKRPSFSTLVESLSQYLEVMAEYVDVGGNEFKLASGRKNVIVLSDRESTATEEEDNSVELLDVPEVKDSLSNTIDEASF